MFSKFLHLFIGNLKFLNKDIANKIYSIKQDIDKNIHER